MSLDIGFILSDWPFEPGQVTARRIRGADDKDKIQLRLDLGLLQMEAIGRPDGQRPHGYESLLDYQEAQLQRHRDQTGASEGFELDERACELLRAEALMYYHRYLAEFVLEDFAAVERDTVRNLRAMDFCAVHAAEESDRYAMEQHRPYVLMMCTRARARLAVDDNRPKAALAILKAGIEKIVAFYRNLGQEALATESGEIGVLKAMVKETEARIPVDPIQQLRTDLDKAVKEERYEDAAQLRDQLRHATGEDPEDAGPANV
jgi:hypothetical protein